MIHFVTFYSKSFIQQEEHLRLTVNELWPECKYCAINLEEEYSGTSYSEADKYNYYSFKPQLIKKYITTVPLNDIIIYIDTNDLPKIGLVKYIKRVMRNREIDLLVSSTNYFHKFKRHPHTKDFFSTFIYTICGYRLQPEAGCIAIRNTKATNAKLTNWLCYTQLIAQANQENFNSQSRHDQEALTYTLFQTRGNLIENWYSYKLFGSESLRKYIEFEGNRCD